MAHTEPRTGDKRQHYRIPIGTSVYIKFDGKEVAGTVSSHDNGDWIYVSWGDTRVSSYLRSSQVYVK